MGAWPVFGFFGLDVLVIYWAFRVNFRRADATEEIAVTPSELRVRRVSHRGHVVEWVLNPLWVQLDQNGDAEFGIERLYLVSRGRRVSIAQLSRAGRKGELCQSLAGGAAGRQARRRPTIRSHDELSEIGWFGAAHEPKSDPMMNLAMT